jgi:hypothetical protein
MWKNTVSPVRPQMTISHMRFAYWNAQTNKNKKNSERVTAHLHKPKLNSPSTFFGWKSPVNENSLKSSKNLSMVTNITSQFNVLYMHFARKKRGKLAHSVTLWYDCIKNNSEVSTPSPTSTFTTRIPWICIRFLCLTHEFFFKLNSSRVHSQLGRQSCSGLTRCTPNSSAESYSMTAERDVSRLKHFGNPCCHVLGGAADVAVVSRHKLLAFFCL